MRWGDTCLLVGEQGNMESWCCWQLPEYHEGSHSKGEAGTKKKHSCGDTGICWNKLVLRSTLSLTSQTHGPINVLYCINQFGYLLLAP